MIRTTLTVIALLSLATVAQARTVSVLDDVFAGFGIVEAKKCKAGFRLNSRGRCVAKPQTTKPSDGGGSSSGSFF